MMGPLELFQEQGTVSRSQGHAFALHMAFGIEPEETGTTFIPRGGLIAHPDGLFGILAGQLVAWVASVDVDKPENGDPSECADCGMLH